MLPRSWMDGCVIGLGRDFVFGILSDGRITGTPTVLVRFLGVLMCLGSPLEERMPVEAGGTLRGEPVCCSSPCCIDLCRLTYNSYPITTDEEQCLRVLLVIWCHTERTWSGQPLRSSILPKDSSKGAHIESPWWQVLTLCVEKDESKVEPFKYHVGRIIE